MKQKSKSKSHFYNDEQDDGPSCTKIFFVSRTHTQLTQAISELRRIRFEVSTPTTLQDEEEEEEDGRKYHPPTRTIALGSRKNLCINDDLLTSLTKGTSKERIVTEGSNNDKTSPIAPASVGGTALDEACRELNSRTSLLSSVSISSFLTHYHSLQALKTNDVHTSLR